MLLSAALTILKLHYCHVLQTSLRQVRHSVFTQPFDQRLIALHTPARVHKSYAQKCDFFTHSTRKFITKYYYKSLAYTQALITQLLFVNGASERLKF